MIGGVEACPRKHQREVEEQRFEGQAALFQKVLRPEVNQRARIARRAFHESIKHRFTFARREGVLAYLSPAPEVAPPLVSPS